LARSSTRRDADRGPLPADEGTRSTGHGLGGDAPADRPEDDVPEVDSENEPPIERSDGQVYGG